MSRKWATVLVLLMCLPTMILADEEPSPEGAVSLEQRVKDLEDRLAEYEEAGAGQCAPGILRKLCLSLTERTSEESSLRTMYDDGFYLVGKDDTLKIGGWAQVDHRFFLDGHPIVNNFFIRRARLDIRGVLENDFAYRLYTAYEGVFGKLQEAWLEYRKCPMARIRIGQFKTPFSLEAMYSAKWIRFIERALGPTNLAPFEDLGIQVFGTLWCKRIEYAVGVFNGRGKNLPDSDSDKEAVGRITFQPFRDCPCHVFENLYVGGSFTTGRNERSLAGLRYRTAARTDFLVFAPGVSQNGNHLRWGTEVEWWWGPCGLSGEYLVSRRRGITDGVLRETLESRAWYVQASYVICGKPWRRNRPIIPCQNFDPCLCRWGAWELGIRYEEFDTDRHGFTSALVTGARNVDALTTGIIWWPNRHIKVMGNYVHTDFNEKIAVSGGVIRGEDALICRFQYEF